MKKLMFSTVMCLLALTSQAQTITKETVYQTYMDAASDSNGEYAYNAEIVDGVVNAQYVYRKEILSVHGNQTAETLKPHLKHCYHYDGQGRLQKRTTLYWNAENSQWHNAYQLTYTYLPSQNIVECSQWNSRTNSFKVPSEKMTYELTSDNTETSVASYIRKKSGQEFQLDYVMTIQAPMLQEGILMTSIQR